jgi:hypothetical protein
MDPTVKGCAAAAERIGYHNFAVLILEERMRPGHIASLFKLSASPQAGRHVALIVLAGGLSRYRAEPLGWSGDVERKLAREALEREHPKVRDVDALLAELSAEAARLVKGSSRRERLATAA